jgi:hypothetical protein
VNAQVALTPLDALAPKLATALAVRLERSRGRFARAASTQVVFAARQPGGMAASSSGSM